MSTHHRARAVVAVAALAIGTMGLSACSVIKAVHKIAGAVEGNRHIIDAFTNNLKSGSPSTFEATYSTTGTSAATVIYAAVSPNQVTVTVTPSSGTGTDVDFVTNSSGPYFCTRPAGSEATWSCDEGGGATTAQEQAIVDLYTPAHWVTFLNDAALAAGFAGDKVSRSTMTVNGFALSCVDLVAPGVSGTSTICSTSQGLLGYANVASSTTSFEITAFSTSPPPSLFVVPAGATINVVPIPTTTTAASH